jgi:hypothetical protein
VASGELGDRESRDPRAEAAVEKLRDYSFQIAAKRIEAQADDVRWTVVLTSSGFCYATAARFMMR